MRMIKYALALMAGMAFSQAAIAGAPGWTNFGTIQLVGPRQYGLDVLVSNLSNPMGCANTDWIRLSINAANYQVIVSQIMTNAANKKTIRFYANQCDSDGVMIVVSVDATA